MSGVGRVGKVGGLVNGSFEMFDSTVDGFVVGQTGADA